MAQPSPLLVILGPTASGKSDLALAIAARTGAEILSVDSMQVYRGMDIGTAKPTISQRAQIRHHGIDLVEPTELFTVARFVEMADPAIADAARRGVRLIATGGTPLYYKALFEGLFAGPSADASVRQSLASLSNEQLHHRLSHVDPAAAARIHTRDTKRLVRALEVHELTGRTISSLQKEWGTSAPRHAAVWVGLEWEREAINRRINARVKAMMAAGWLEETRQLLATHGSLSATAGEATGYYELLEHLASRLELDDAIEQIKIATRQLARRQMKWLRRFANVHWLPGDAAPDAHVQTIIDRWAQ